MLNPIEPWKQLFQYWISPFKIKKPQNPWCFHRGFFSCIYKIMSAFKVSVNERGLLPIPIVFYLFVYIPICYIFIPPMAFVIGGDVIIFFNDLFMATAFVKNSYTFKWWELICESLYITKRLYKKPYIIIKIIYLLRFCDT